MKSPCCLYIILFVCLYIPPHFYGFWGLWDFWHHLVLCLRTQRVSPYSESVCVLREGLRTQRVSPYSESVSVLRECLRLVSLNVFSLGFFACFAFCSWFFLPAHSLYLSHILRNSADSPHVLIRVYKGMRWKVSQQLSWVKGYKSFGSVVLADNI
jgi:hypothetical protein